MRLSLSTDACDVARDAVATLSASIHFLAAQGMVDDLMACDQAVLTVFLNPEMTNTASLQKLLSLLRWIMQLLLYVMYERLTDIVLVGVVVTMTSI